MSPLRSILLACNRTFSTQTHWAKSVTLQWICSYPGVDSDAKRCPKTARELQFLCQQFWLVPLEKGVRYTRSFHIFSKYLWACCLRVKTFPLSTLGIQKLEWRTQLDIQTCLSCTLKAAAEWFLHNMRMWFMSLLCSLAPVPRLCHALLSCKL